MGSPRLLGILGEVAGNAGIKHPAVITVLTPSVNRDGYKFVTEFPSESNQAEPESFVSHARVHPKEFNIPMIFPSRQPAWLLSKDAG